MKINGFKIDHRHLKRGVYVSRVDEFNGGFITTIDIRVKEPALKQFLSPAVSHTIEHICATYFRTESYLKNNVVYFGPMGDLTGFYLILKGKRQFGIEQVWWEINNAFKRLSDWDSEIPGSKDEECGNPEFHNIEAAKAEAKEYVEYLSKGANEVNSQYPISRIGIIVTMESEAKIIESLGLDDKYSIKTVVAGIGKVNAAIATERLISEFGPHLIISFGHSGGITSEFSNIVELHDIVVATTSKYHDVWCGEGETLGQVQGFPKEFNCKVSAPVVKLAQKAQSIYEDSNIVYGCVATGDKFIIKDELEFIKENFPEVIAVDMESTSVAQTCFMNNVDFAAVRIVSDIIGSDSQTEDNKETVYLVSE